jgi:hypothetical protein
MSESAVGGASPGPAPSRFQFSIRRVLWLTAVCAVACALARSLDAPGALRVVVVVYLGALAAYAGLRLPYVGRKILHCTPEWDEVRRKRQALEALVAERRQQRDKSATPPAEGEG